MANAKYERIWKLLDEYTFTFDSPLSDEFLCVSCNSILKNPYQSPCGCRFCMECVVKYLNSDEKYCPGSSDDCKYQVINFQGDLHIDYVINRKISQLKVKCPKALCDHWNDLQSIGNHLNSHEETCPFTNIGCQYPSAHMRLVVDHLNHQMFHHGKLVAESFTNLKNEMTSLTLALQLSKQESENKDNLLLELDNRLTNLQRSHEIKIQELTETIDKFKEENAQLILQLNALKSYSGNCSEKQEFNKCEGNEDKYLHGKEEAKCEHITQLKLTESNFNNPFYAPFEWKITNFKALKANTIIPSYVASSPFYSRVNGYKFCITIHPNGTGLGLGTHLSVFIHIMKGEFDESLYWPMKLDLRICIVDQVSGATFADTVFRYSSRSSINKHKYHRPFGIKNIGIGESQYFKLDELFRNSRIYSEDSIIIKCFIS